MKKTDISTSTVGGSHEPRPAPRRATGRPRSDASRRAVLDAAYAILLETGLAGFSVDGVATRSGVARTTIYRSWPSKGLLAMESFREVFEAQITFEQSQVPERDLHRLVGSLTQALAGPAGRLAASVLAEAQSDPAVQKQFLDDFSTPLRHRSTEVLEAGVASGRFRADLDIPRVLDAIVGAVYLRLLFGQPLDADWADGLSDMLLQACLRSAPS
jgi:AcrR family transcriptional regulator